MAASDLAVGRRMPARTTVAVLAILAGLALWFLRENVLHYVTSHDITSYTPYYSPGRSGLLLHLTGGVVALSVGLAQLWLGLSGQTGTLHRRLGRVYLGGVALGSAGGFYMALTIDPKSFAYLSGLFMLSAAWLLTTTMAFVAIRRRAIAQHRQWMIRSYVVTFAFVTLRLADKLLAGWHVVSEDEYFTALAWACSAVPLLVAEPLLQLGTLRRRAA